MKYLKFLAIAAAVVAFAVSCGKDNKETVNLDPAPYYDNAAVFHAPADNQSEWEDFMFFTDGTGRARRLKNSGGALTSIQPRKRVAEYEYKTFTYTVNGTKYVIVGLFANEATFEFNPETGVLTIETVENGNPVSITITGVSQAAPLDNVSFLAQLCRKWKVSAIDIHVEGGDLKEGGISGGQVFKHGNLYKIGQAIQSKGVSFDVEQLKGYEIVSIKFGPTGVIEIVFKEQDDYVGEWGLDKAGKFFYELDYGQGNNLINADANGTVTIGDGKCKLDIQGTIKAKNDYTTTISITLVPAN